MVARFSKGFSLYFFSLRHNFGMTQDELILMIKDPSTAPLDEKHKSLLLFALKVANEPTTINSADIDELRALNISDKAIFELSYMTSYLVMSDALLTAFKVQD